MSLNEIFRKIKFVNFFPLWAKIGVRGMGTHSPRRDIPIIGCKPFLVFVLIHNKTTLAQSISLLLMVTGSDAESGSWHTPLEPYGPVHYVKNSDQKLRTTQGSWEVIFCLDWSEVSIWSNDWHGFKILKILCIWAKISKN